MAIRTETTIAGLRAELDGRRARGQTIALVPTMGFLHDGHLSLVDRAREQCDVVVMSIFVNPLQFAPQEDLATYPRDLERDRKLAGARGVDILFVPDVFEMYPERAPLMLITAPRLTRNLCGRFRPGHFEGVLTVVAKLFNLVQPSVAVFGRKDLQQAVVIQRMVRDLDFPIRIDVAEITREPDGLAMSSRNVYLDPAQRTAALALSRALRAASTLFDSGERQAALLIAGARHVLDAEAGVKLQYIELVATDALEPVETAQPGSALAVAGFVGRTRLIDNIIFGA